MQPLANVRLSELQRKRVIDSAGTRIGHVNDIWLEQDGSFSLIVGGGFIQETLQRLHVRPEIDLLVPPEWIESVGADEIIRRWTRFQLESTCQECWDREKERLFSGLAAEPDRQEALRLTVPHA